MFTRLFWTAALERAVKTFTQAAGAVLLSGGLGLLGVPWQHALAAGGVAALLSVATSLYSAVIGPNRGSPSLAGERLLPPPPPLP